MRNKLITPRKPKKYCHYGCCEKSNAAQHIAEYVARSSVILGYVFIGIGIMAMIHGYTP